MHDTKRKQYEQLARKYHIKLVFIIAERKEHGHPVNGYLKERIIYLNETLEEHTDKILGHELTHFIKSSESFKSIQNTLFEYAKKNGEYDSRLKSITELYKGIDTDLQEELTADLAGDYIFNEEFVNELVQDKTAFQKVYDHIKEWLKVVTSGSQEYKQIYEAKKLFEKALKDNEKKAPEGTKYFLNKQGQEINFDEEKAINNAKEILEMNPIVELSGKEFQKDNVSIYDKVNNYYTTFGSKAYNSVIGEVRMNLTDIKSSAGHGIGATKSAAFMAVKDIIENGEFIDFENNWKNKGYDTCIIAGKIKIANDNYLMGIVVRQLYDGNTFYVHEVVLGTVDNIKKGSSLSSLYDTSSASGFKSGGASRKGSGKRLVPYMYSLFQKAMDSQEENTKFSLSGTNKVLQNHRYVSKLE